MKLTFTFIDTPELDALTRDGIYQTHFEVPGEATYLIGLEDRILGVANLIGQLSEAALHLSCQELGPHHHLITSGTASGDSRSLWANIKTIVFQFSRIQRNRTQNRQLRILKPCIPPLPQHYFSGHSKKRRDRRSLNKNLSQVNGFKVQDQSAQQYFDNISALADQMLMLLNAEPAASPIAHWYCAGFNPWWSDNRLIDRFNKQSKRAATEHRKQERLQEKLKKLVDSNPDSPTLKTGAGRRPGAIPGVFKGVQFRSQLEIRFATELESRGIRWVYETERLGKGNYLVDFYLPNLKTWVEVNGRFEPRDNYLLKDVAGYLRQERSERLFVYTNGTCYAVHPSRFTEIKQKNFWERLLSI
jgi:hypothetical protein